MGYKLFFDQKIAKRYVFLNIKFCFKIIVVDLRRSFFDVSRKGDVHENICSQPFVGDFAVGMFYLG